MVVTARTANLQPGEYSSTLIVDTVNGESSSLFIPVRLTVRPVVILPSISSVVNAAGSLAGPTAARMIVTIFGDSLASGAVTASVSPLPTRLGDTEVKANGVSLQLFYAGPTQINAVMPERLIDPRVGLVVQRGDTRSPELSVEIAPAAPSFFEVIADGEGRAAITDAFGRVITRSNPARPGQVLIGYLSGMGTAVTRTDNSGLLDFSITPRVVVNGIAAQILYAGPAPGTLGLDQVNFVVPVGFVTPADAVLYIEQQGRRTKSAQIPLAE